MKHYTVTVIEMETGLTRHITGKWPDWQTMEEALMEDGYIVTWWTEG